MKYVITESRLDELIQNYISESVGLLERHSSHDSYSYSNYMWYTNLKDVMIFEIAETDEGLGLGVLESLWNSVNGMFSLSDYDTDKAFMKWMLNYKGGKFPGGIYTFENG